MAVTSAIVMFAVIWWLALLCILPFNTRSQEEAGEVVPGTPSSAPENPRIGRTMLWTTGLTVVLWSALFFGMQATGWSLRDLADPPDYTAPREAWRPAGAASAGEGARAP
ncbi:DUF1467 family protein [Neomegalonema sp.]|uniref:DUF1467 family protein n=1 Tax=Neomegalonema sp. TaxID=2039713 RepID=UPI00261784C3|nr:DUF1467 family protein [Neomegalonema sp.]MDD2870050.1 DUF1467 family protein [Neomegalonema sp.]